MRIAVTLCVVLALCVPGVVDATPTGRITWAVHVTSAPTWFDPAETSGIVTSLMLLYALHDALVKPMPGNAMAPSLAESWTMSKDGLTYEFVLRKGVRFHDGSPVTPADAKLSFERYRGTLAKALKDRIARVETPDGSRGRFVLKQPGVELTLEAFEQYWRKTPSVKTLVCRVVADEATRLAALKRGEVDVAYSITGPLAEELVRTPGLTLAPIHFTFTTWLLFTEQLNETNPRVRQQILHKAQQLIHERAMFAPVIEPAFLNGVGSRVAFHGLGAVGNFPYSSLDEDLKLEAK